MARYSTTTSIYKMLIGLQTSPANNLIIQHFADRVGGQIDGYAGRWYKVSSWDSSTSTPQLILQISDSIVSHLVMRSKFIQDGQNKNKWVDDLAEKSYEDLEKIRKQELILLDSTGSEVARADRGSLIESTREQYTPVFDLDSSTSWGVDSDLVDTIENDRL